ncbi:MAG: Na+/H+ antiporter subunit E [Candidatus Cloacimonetes bacterium]|nr:Na+/H+ antiporter subunit E [Candidatus Cloacimonadota bacterium]
MKLKTKSRIVVFILSFITYFTITQIGRFDWQELIVGVIISLITSVIAGDILIVIQRKFKISRIFYTILYIFRLFVEIFKANIHVAYLVIHPKLPIKPGIVKIKTGLKSDSGLTMLANSITLTPGTMTVDINKEKGELYIHWIDVKTSDVDKATELIGGRFEKIIKEIFE